jgi:uncharacterized protein (UPF0332 family)
MDAREFHTLAQQLSLAATEAAWRSAVSRAYYAAFHVARQLMEDLGFTVPHADRAHGYLWLRLANCGNLQVEQAANALKDLRRNRNWADYDLARPLGQLFSQNQGSLAAQIIQVFEAAAIGPTCTQITDAMKIYERDVLHDVTWHP